jgi:hypothetical protein
MMIDIIETETEKKVKQAMQVFEAVPISALPFEFPERSMAREEVLGRLQKGLDHFTAVRNARVVYEAALEAHRRALPGLKQFHAEARDVARKHFGSDAKVMEILHPKRTGRRCRRSRGGAPAVGEEVITTVIEEVITTRESVPCGSREPTCEAPPRPFPCRPKRVPSRGTKAKCEAQKACGAPGRRRG